MLRSSPSSLHLVGQVPGFNRNQPQYAYAVGAIALVLLQLFTRFAVAAYRYHGHMNQATAWALVVAEVVVLAFGASRGSCLKGLHPSPHRTLLTTATAIPFTLAGLALYGITSSAVVLATVVFGPPVLVRCPAASSVDVAYSGHAPSLHMCD
jgi:hypothetical protein